MRPNLLFSTLIGALALLIGSPAAAQVTTWTDPAGGFAVDLQPGMTQIQNTTSLSAALLIQVTSPETGAQMGLCMVMRDRSTTVLTQAHWDRTVAQNFSTSAFGQKLTQDQGHTWLRGISSRAFTSRAGWAGYIHVLERTNKDTGKQQMAVSGGTMLAGDVRILLQCATPTTGGPPFSTADLARIERMFTSVRRP